MRMNDIVYGPVEITEPVLLDLLVSNAIRRLHGVLQHGITALVGITRPTTRYEHSLGAMLLVRRLGAGLREQIAAMLHDVSTKLRTIDPTVLVDGQARPLSALDPEFAAYRQAYLESKQGLWPMRVVTPAERRTAP